jgi:hypothetical protein
MKIPNCSERKQIWLPEAFLDYALSTQCIL